MLSRIEVYAAVGLIFALLAGGVYVRDRIQKAEIAALKTEIANVKAQAEVIEKKQKATEKTVAAMKVRGKANVQTQAKVDQIIEGSDDAALDKLFLDRGMFTPKASPTPSRPPGRP